MKAFPRPVIVLSAAHLALFSFVALFRPWAFLLDDAYYSLTVAANIAAGKGVTYGGFPTNGFQPLYSFLMAPVFALIGGHRVLCLRIALLFCALCSTASILVLYRIAERVAGRAAGILAAIMGALSVNLLAHAASGLETALHAFLFLLVVDFYTARRNAMTMRQFAALGLLLACLAYGRLDACFVFLAIAIDRFMVRRSDVFCAIADNLAIFVLPALLLAPWFAWNLAAFGTIAQSPAAFHHWRGMETQHVTYALPGFAAFAAVKLASLALKLPLEPLFGYRALVTGPSSFLFGGDKLHTNFAIQLWQKSHALALMLGVLLAAALALLVFFGRRRAREGIKNLRPLAWVLWALAGAAIYYPLVLLNYSMRHFYSYSLLLSIPAAMVAAGLLRIERNGPVLASKKNALLIALLAVAIFRCGPFDPRLPSGNDYGFARIADIRATIPAGASIGYTDCGFYGYFLPDYTVVNLDGILNFKALEAMKQNRMSGYLVEKKVGYVLALDNLHNEYRRQFETDMLSVLEKEGGSDFIYRVKAPLPTIEN